eukprot:ctg_962.g382
MAGVGSGYDLSTTTFSPEGRVFQLEYANKAVELSGTVVGVVCRDAVVLAVENVLPHRFVVSGTLRRVHTVDRHVAIAVGLPGGVRRGDSGAGVGGSGGRLCAPILVVLARAAVWVHGGDWRLGCGGWCGVVCCGAGRQRVQVSSVRARQGADGGAHRARQGAVGGARARRGDARGGWCGGAVARRRQGQAVRVGDGGGGRARRLDPASRRPNRLVKQSRRRRQCQRDRCGRRCRHRPRRPGRWPARWCCPRTRRSPPGWTAVTAPAARSGKSKQGRRRDTGGGRAQRGRAGARGGSCASSARGVRIAGWQRETAHAVRRLKGSLRDSSGGNDGCQESVFLHRKRGGRRGAEALVLGRGSYRRAFSANPSLPFHFLRSSSSFPLHLSASRKAF